MGNGAYGQCGHRGQWGTGDVAHMGNEAYRAKWYRGYGVQAEVVLSLIDVPKCANHPWAPLAMCPITPVPHLDLIGIGNIH